MAAPHESDDISTLARRLAEQLVALCPHVPADELTELSSTLAFREVAQASGVAFDHTEQDGAVVPLGNHIVWLPGASGTAIVLPAGEEPPGAAATAARLLTWARQRAVPISKVATRSSTVLRQVGSAVLNAYQARVRVQ